MGVKIVVVEMPARRIIPCLNHHHNVAVYTSGYIYIDQTPFALGLYLAMLQCLATIYGEILIKLEYWNL
jgi:hypothetical protein